jgi:hypothetical protein
MSEEMGVKSVAKNWHRYSMSVGSYVSIGKLFQSRLETTGNTRSSTVIYVVCP